MLEQEACLTQTRYGHNFFKIILFDYKSNLQFYLNFTENKLNNLIIMSHTQLKKRV